MQTLGAMLGAEPERLNQVVTMYPEHSISMVTEALNKVYRRDAKGGDSYTGINAMAYTWTVKAHMLPKIKIVQDCTAVGQNREEFDMILERKYYDKGDTFRLENHTMLFVRRRPEMINKNRWKYRVTLTGNDLNRRLNPIFAAKNRWTKYVTNFFPELSERGYSKFLYNAEKHIGYMSRHRVSDSWSGDWAMQKEIVMRQGKNSFFKMEAFDKNLLDQFMLAREQKNLFSESNYDSMGKCLDQDEEGRDIPMGDGIIPQFSRYSQQVRYNEFERTIMDDAIDAVTNKAVADVGNTLVLAVNKRLWQQFNRWSDNVAKDRLHEPYFVKKNGDYLKLGATYSAYEFAGNTVVFMPNRALTDHYENQGFGILFDMGNYNGAPNIELMTLTGADLISGTVKGLGGINGRTSGEVSTSVHGSEEHLLGYSGVKVANPYTGFVIKENVTF